MIKAYVAGEEVFAGVKRFSPGSYATDDVEPRLLNRAERDLARAVGRGA